MPQNLYLASTYLKLLCSDQNLHAKLVAKLGVRLDDLLQADFIHEDDLKTIFSVAKEQDLDSWLLEFGDKISIASHGPLGFAVLSAPDLITAMQVLVDYSVIRSSVFGCELNQRGNRLEFAIIDHSNLPEIAQWLVEVDLFVTQSLIQAVTAHPLGDNALISFSCSPPHYLEKLKNYYGVPCVFNASANAISIPASWGQISSPLSDPSSFSANLLKCRELKLALCADNNALEIATLTLNRFFEARINGEDLSNPLPKLTQLAQQNHCSARTFARRLEQQNHSYKSVLESCRKRQAERLLCTTHHSIADIAEYLAYKETANFVRAFKTWFDIPPATWRRQPRRANVQ